MEKPKQLPEEYLTVHEEAKEIAEKNGTVEHRYEETIICPHCDYKVPDPENYQDSGITECPSCKRDMYHERMNEWDEFSGDPPTYSTASTHSEFKENE